LNAQKREVNNSQMEDVTQTISVLDHIWFDAAYNRDLGELAWLFASNFGEIHPVVKL
jgi:hypothetical protein